MFRTNQNSELSHSKFSVGSIVKSVDGDQRWLVVGRSTHPKAKNILLVDLSNFTITGCTDVEDLNFLTEKEVHHRQGT